MSAPDRPTPTIQATRRDHAPAFTLLEILAAIAIVALMAGLAALSLRGAVNRASHEQVVHRLIAYDHSARLAAERFGRPITINVEPARLQQAWVANADEDEPRTPPRGPLHLPAGYRAQRVPAGKSTGAAGGLDAQAAVRFSTRGRSPTYALRLTGPDGRVTWVLFAGLTGQVTSDHNEARIRGVLATLDANHRSKL